MLQSVVSLVPRTLWHIMSVPDGAVDWKWLVELPSSIPKIIENSVMLPLRVKIMVEDLSPVL